MAGKVHRQCFLAVGACYLDTILTVSYYPGEDEKLRARSIVRRRGGNCPNSLEVLQDLLRAHGPHHIDLTLCTVLPSAQSPASQEIAASLNGVDFSACLYRDEHTEAASSYIIKSASSSSRTIVNYNELEEMTLEEFEHSVKDLKRQNSRLSWCHFEGRNPEVSLQCMDYLGSVDLGIYISVEIEKPGRPGLEELAARANLVFFSKGWAMSKGYTSAKGCVQAHTRLCPMATALACTWGADGAVLATRATILEAKWDFSDAEPAHSNVEVVDTVGAGDTFIAGMLYGRLSGDSHNGLTARTLHAAVQLASRKVRQEGFEGLGESWALPPK